MQMNNKPKDPKPKVAMLLDIRRKKADNTYPVKLRITFERKQVYYSTGLNVTPEHYDNAMFGKRQTDAEKETKKAIQAFEDKATKIIKDLPFFDWTKFENKYFTNRAAKDTLELAFGDIIGSLRNDGRIGTAVTYEITYTSLNKFQAGLKFADVTPDFLRKYEKWLLANGRSVTTVGIYLRTLRAVFNNAIGEGLLTQDLYPFGKKRYEIPTGNNIKKALTIKDIAAIYYHPTEPGSVTDMAKDYWLFMYLCNGINMKDLCLLKYENIKGEVLEFVRAKTVRTKRKVEAIRITLVDDAKTIIEKWGNTKVDGSTYIFPILTHGITPERLRDLVKLKTRLVNDHMKIIAASLGIESNVTSYSARHSFATILQRSGANISFISEALGHGNIQTTQNYLAGFEDDKKAEVVQALTAFKKQPESKLKAV
jgi:integrase/recombinase XerD